MMVGIPAIIVAGILRRQINTAQEGGPAIHDGAFLMERLREMCDRAAAVVEQTVYTYRR